jgi:peptidoglycan/LPS O-acetylase OafA/YrhL
MFSLTAASFPQADDGVWGVGALLAGPAILVYHRKRLLAPLLGPIAWMAGAGTLAMYFVHDVGTTNSDETIETVLVVAGFAYLALAVFLGRQWNAPWRHAVGFVATAAWAIALAVFSVDTVQLDFEGSAELVVGVALLAVLAAAVGLREKGAVIAAAVGVAIDAIAFAFDVGGEWAGFITIVAVAVALLTGAGYVKRFLRE